MNAVDQVLSDAADVVDNAMKAQGPAHAEIVVLTQAGQKPHVLRLLPDDLQVTITIEKARYT